MRKYEIGDKIPNGEMMVRRLEKQWVMSDQTISREAFRPRLCDNGQFEDGVSVDIKRLLKYTIGNDRWSKRSMATGEFLSDIVNVMPLYKLIYNGPSPSHCIISGDMYALFYDFDSLNAMAQGTICTHNPNL